MTEATSGGSGLLDQPGDVEWVKATARFVKRHDPYGHLVTVHPVVSASTRGKSPGDSIDPPWRIGEFYGNDRALDVLSQQTGQAGVWDDALQCWTGDAPTLVASLRADLRYGKPVLNSESGYEYLRGYPTQGRGRQRRGPGRPWEAVRRVFACWRNSDTGSLIRQRIPAGSLV
jgi:hypothetical protein